MKRLTGVLGVALFAVFAAQSASAQSACKNRGELDTNYCDENGEVTEESNPNGSLLNIAGICNEGRNVFGMMPHPERAADPDLNNTDGLEIMKQLILQTV